MLSVWRFNSTDEELGGKGLFVFFSLPHFRSAVSFRADISRLQNTLTGKMTDVWVKKSFSEKNTRVITLQIIFLHFCKGEMFYIWGTHFEQIPKWANVLEFQDLAHVS